MSWFFGSSKKKDPPQVTVDPNPIDGFVMVQNSQQPAHSQTLYPHLNNGGYPLVPSPSSLPYAPTPNRPMGIPSTPSSGNSSTRALGSGVNEIHNQLESVPFIIATHLNTDSSGGFSNNYAALKESGERLDKLKQCLRNGEFEYDFKLERSILREAKMVNGACVEPSRDAPLY